MGKGGFWEREGGGGGGGEVRVHKKCVIGDVPLKCVNYLKSK